MAMNRNGEINKMKDIVGMMHTAARLLGDLGLDESVSITLQSKINDLAMTIDAIGYEAKKEIVAMRGHV